MSSENRNKVAFNSNDVYLILTIQGESLKFPFVWLRDNCQCEKCFHSSAKSRFFDWSQFDQNIKPKLVTQDEVTVKITWTDGHNSRFKLSWLKFRSFTPENQKRYNEAIYKPEKIVWHDADFPKIFSKYDYRKVLEDDASIYDFLLKLSTYGVALIQNTPSTNTALEDLIEVIGFTKRTHYGHKFVVQHVVGTSNVAYLPSNLQMHTDLPYYEQSIGTNFLHCLVQTTSEGGENLLVDCHYIGQYMKENHPRQYKLLTDTEVEWSDVGVEHGREFFKLHRAPVICLDRHGAIVRINFSVPQRSSNFPGPIEQVIPWYEAHKLFLELSHKFAAKFKSSSGDILVFDNIRLLHGRTGYVDAGNNVRKIIGAYVDWDEIYSKLRCLKMKLWNEDGIW